MWWLRGIFTIGLAMGLVSCGSSGFDVPNGSDQLVLSFQGYSGEGITQPDFVGNTSASIDVCLGVCVDDTEITAEPYSSARIFASFANAGRSDILIDRYTVTIPGSGVPSRTTSINEPIAGGRCSNGQACSSDQDCGLIGGACAHLTSGFEILLIDIPTKDLVRSGTCPMLNPDFTISPGTLIPQTLQVQVSFSGSDNTGERYNVSAGIAAEFENFDNCDSAN